MLSLFLSSTAGFLVLHWAVGRWLEAPFHVELKVSRGLASVFLVLVGLGSLVLFFPLWRRAFLTPHEFSSPASAVVVFLAGHLVADLLWLAYGALVQGSQPRRDLILHHLLGLAACAVSLGFGFGQAVIAVALTAEAMPVATGLGAWGKLTGDRRLERRAVVASLSILCLWRVPAWFFVGGVAVWAVLRPPGDALPFIYPLCVAVAGCLVALDLFWIRRLWAGLVGLEGAREEPLVEESP
ncbi:MAG: TLC domain-containing protein [Acidobacteriota bacterium]|nr:TLC domain-containing protein [Acidobacteriota bacterium]